jgi:hypothetical protein
MTTFCLVDFLWASFVVLGPLILLFIVWIAAFAGVHPSFCLAATHLISRRRTSVIPTRGQMSQA